MQKGIETIFMGLGLVVFAAIIGMLLAFPVKWAWNYTMPYLFDFKIISWGQTWCLNFLAHCLVKTLQISTFK